MGKEKERVDATSVYVGDKMTRSRTSKVVGYEWVMPRPAMKELLLSNDQEDLASFRGIFVMTNVGPLVLAKVSQTIRTSETPDQALTDFFYDLVTPNELHKLT